jgi:hypothetical protein
METIPNNSDPETLPQKEYHSPELIKYGSLKDLTKAESGPPNDGIMEGSESGFDVHPRHSPG